MLAVAIMVGGKISGGHFNPASVMMVAANKLKMNDAAPYILAQVAGGLVVRIIQKNVNKYYLIYKLNIYNLYMPRKRVSRKKEAEKKKKDIESVVEN